MSLLNTVHVKEDDAFHYFACSLVFLCHIPFEQKLIETGTFHKAGGCVGLFPAPSN
jgi:hypothetical protein